MICQENILITEEGDARIGDFGITAIISDPDVVERTNLATSSPGVIRYMAPELLNPKQFGLKRSNPSKETDVYSFAMTSYKVFSSYLVARVTDKCPLPVTRSSRGSRRMVENRTVLRPFVSCPASDHLAQIIQRQASGYRIRSGALFRAVGPRIHSPGCLFIHYTKNSHRRDRNKRKTPQTVRIGRLKVTYVIRWTHF